MAVETVKSASVTARDATPATPQVTGKTAGGYMKTQDDHALVPASASADSKFFMVRVPTNAKLKNLIFSSAAMGAGKFDIGLWYSANANGQDGTPLDLRGDVIDQDFFASVVDCASAVVPTDIKFEAGNFTYNDCNLPLWEAAGLSADPGGMFDIIATVKTTDVTTGAARIHLQANYVE